MGDTGQIKDHERPAGGTGAASASGRGGTGAHRRRLPWSWPSPMEAAARTLSGGRRAGNAATSFPRAVLDRATEALRADVAAQTESATGSLRAIRATPPVIDPYGPVTSVHSRPVVDDGHAVGVAAFSFSSKGLPVEVLSYIAERWTVAASLGPSRSPGPAPRRPGPLSGGPRTGVGGRRHRRRPPRLSHPWDVPPMAVVAVLGTTTPGMSVAARTRPVTRRSIPRRQLPPGRDAVPDGVDAIAFSSGPTRPATWRRSP